MTNQVFNAMYTILKACSLELTLIFFKLSVDEISTYDASVPD